MKKKLMIMLMAGAMSAALVSTAHAEDIKIWVADAVVNFTQEQVDAFMEANPDFADYDVTIEPVGEGDAAGNMVTDVEAGPDIYVFAQ